MYTRLLGLICMMALICSIAFAQVANAGYRLSPQDKITITVLKHAELSQSFVIPPDGVIDVPRAGRVNVVGKTTAEVAAELKGLLAAWLRDPDVTVVLAEARLRSAYALGAVAKPGQYPLLPGARLTELLAAAGDIVGEREKLTATLIRGPQSIPVRLQDAVSGKDPTANLELNEGDLLWIKTPDLITIVVSGQVKTPGALKLEPGSTLVDAIVRCGDLTARPERVRLSLVRGANQQRLKWGTDKVILQDGDLIIAEQEPVTRIYINGHVKNPGAYELSEGGGVMEAIALAGGVLERPSLSKVTIVRADTGKSERVDLTGAMLKGNLSENPKLASGDQVIVPESTAKVAILGMVRTPGSLLLNEGKPLTVVDAISMAGGGEKRAKLSKVVVIRQTEGKLQRIPVDVNAILKKGKQDQNMVLQPDDVVYVPETDRPDWTRIIDNLYRVGMIATIL